MTRILILVVMYAGLVTVCEKLERIAVAVERIR